MLPNFEIDANNVPNGFFIDFATEDQMGISSVFLVARKVGQKQYELKDHLGNVRVVVSDLKLSMIVNESPRIFNFSTKKEKLPK